MSHCISKSLELKIAKDILPVMLLNVALLLFTYSGNPFVLTYILTLLLFLSRS